MTDRLTEWLGRWLGVQLPIDDPSAVWQWRSAWPWAPSVTVLLVLFVVGWVVFFYSRESSTAGRLYRAMLAALRIGVIAILLFMLTELVIILNRTGSPGIVLIIDRSASMQITDEGYTGETATAVRERLNEGGMNNLSRINLARLLLTDNDARLLEQLQENYQLQVYFVAEGIERQPGSDGNVEDLAARIRELGQSERQTQATRLGDAVRQSLRELPGGMPAAVILLTDGVNTEGASLAAGASLARRRGVPIFAVGLGSERPVRDVELSDVLVDRVVFVDDLVSFQATIRGTGMEGESVRVVLRQDSDPAVLDSESVVMNEEGESQGIRLTHRPTEAGDVNYLVEIEPPEGEVNRENNRSRHAVSVRDEKIRVLFANGYPSYEFRYLKNLLDRDRSVEVATYLQEADADYAQQDASALRSFPVARDALLEYDVVLFGDMNPRLLPRSVWDSLQSLVTERGGGVAFIAGPRYFPWMYRDVEQVATLLPVELDSMPSLGTAGGIPGFSVQPTPLGLRTASLQLGTSVARSRSIWQNLSPLYWLAETGPAKPAAQVLAVHPSRTGADGRNLPAICLQYVGNGRVLYHAIDESWRWRIRVGDVYFARYWVQSVRLLARSTLAGRGGVELTVDRREYRVGEPVDIRARFFDQRLAPGGGEDATVLVESPGGRRERVTLQRNSLSPGVFEGTLSGLARGDYRVLLVEPAPQDEPPSSRFRVVAPPGELARLEMDRSALSAAATTTHGKFYTFPQADQLADDLPAGRRVPIESLPPVPLWNQPLLLVLLLAMLIAEWLLRRRVGML